MRTTDEASAITSDDHRASGLSAHRVGKRARLGARRGRGDAETDACVTLGQIVRLDPKGDNFLAVRGGPGSQRPELDRLGGGALVTICDERGPWLGIVYPAPGTKTDCGVSSPRPTRSPYGGPCRSGWVHSRFVDVVAG